ncbi:hypothetical protein HK103_001744 [Boothiomyces macroporosus]|uniref:SET domain-containing protein n=1 Tax=Boothiomyces macroporosus TaxID=261099 RepID=A0AAD5UMB7_9FUNG|nr:hypothetical protein HK103_001744 [Boothiomyces macroporosus]
MNTALSDQYPSYPKKIEYGYGLFASDDLPPNTVAYVLLCKKNEKWVWLLTFSNARYANHSCRPNCTLNDNQELVTLTNVQKGEELNFVYNGGSEDDEWDPIWTFKCECKNDNCQGMIDRYRRVDRRGNPVK